jgi:hypothetical protein
MSDEFLAKSKTTYEVVHPHILLTLADGRHSDGRLVHIEDMKLGPFAIGGSDVVVCRKCVLLLGEADLAKFALQSSKVEGVDVMTVSRRGR